jgi:hypothetical protein
MKISADKERGRTNEHICVHVCVTYFDVERLFVEWCVHIRNTVAPVSLRYRSFEVIFLDEYKEIKLYKKSTKPYLIFFISST